MIELRRLTKADIPSLTKLANNRKIWDNLRDVMPHPYSEKDADEFIEKIRREHPARTFAVEYQGRLAGVIGILPEKDVYRLSAEIGYWIGEPYWNKGIATEAIRLTAEYAFDVLNLIRLHCGVFEHNKASMRALEKAGFTREGIFRKAVIKNGKIINEHRFALVKEF